MSSELWSIWISSVQLQFWMLDVYNTILGRNSRLFNLTVIYVWAAMQLWWNVWHVVKTGRKLICIGPFNYIKADLFKKKSILDILKHVYIVIRLSIQTISGHLIQYHSVYGQDFSTDYIGHDLWCQDGLFKSIFLLLIAYKESNEPIRIFSRIVNHY